jgi:hypothetical protein
MEQPLRKYLKEFGDFTNAMDLYEKAPAPFNGDPYACPNPKPELTKETCIKCDLK